MADSALYNARATAILTSIGRTENRYYPSLTITGGTFDKSLSITSLTDWHYDYLLLIRIQNSMISSPPNVAINSK